MGRWVSLVIMNGRHICMSICAVLSLVQQHTQRLEGEYVVAPEGKFSTFSPKESLKVLSASHFGRWLSG